MRNMLKPHYKIVKIATMIPHGQLGILRVVNSHKLNSLLQLLIPARTLERLKENTAFLRRWHEVESGQVDVLFVEHAKYTMRHPDFAEGVRAMVVDKDRKPNWRPGRIEEVDPAAIAGLFE